MPRGDRTGPAGLGPRTGWASGYCGGYDMPGYANPGPGRGRGWGFGQGRGGFGRGRGFGGRWHGLGFARLPDWIPWGAGRRLGLDAEADRQVLKSQADALRAQLRAVESHLAESEEKKERPE
ncbi:MAG: DUF5320 domain-containing protein [Acidobacteriota bacterium]|nr:DUF5320 domain-containing protein [Acidobacteriota bacterium]